MEAHNRQEKLQPDLTQLVELVDTLRFSDRFYKSYLGPEALNSKGAVMGEAISGAKINDHDISINILQFPNSTTYEISGYKSPFDSSIIDGFWEIRVNPLHKELLEAAGYSGSDAVSLDDEFIHKLTDELARQANG